MAKKSTILDEMAKKQIKNIDIDKTLSYRDFSRIVKNINTSIFSPTSCCIWTGYVTNVWNHKSTFINFYFKKKKVALHRLLYNNFIGPICDTEYIKFSCNNKGRCCNVLHYIILSKDNINDDNASDVIIDDDNATDDNATDDDNGENGGGGGDAVNHTHNQITKVPMDQSAFTLYFD